MRCATARATVFTDLSLEGLEVTFAPPETVLSVGEAEGFFVTFKPAGTLDVELPFAGVTFFDASFRFPVFEPVFFVFKAIPLPWDYSLVRPVLTKGSKLFPLRPFRSITSASVLPDPCH
jgi:hypothetical protein